MPPRGSRHKLVWKRPWLLAGLVTILAGVGFLIGHPKPGTRPGFALAAFGPHFSVTMNSQPPGAAIGVDGKELGLVTPTTVELVAGTHQVTLTLAGKGSATYQVSGERDEHTTLDALMYGAIKILFCVHR